MKKFIVFVSLFSMVAQGMLEKQGSLGHVRMCSTPGGLWSLEKESCIHRRISSSPDNFGLYVNPKLETQGEQVKSSRSKKKKSSNSQKIINKKSSEIYKSEPKAESRKPSDSVKQKIIDAKNRQQKTDQHIVKLLKKKSHEERFSKFLGNHIGKFISDIFF